MHWKAIMANRTIFDDILKGMGHHELIVSSISGMFNSPKKNSSVVKMVYPALAYWVMTQRGDFAAQDIIMALAKEAMSTKAEVRYLSSTNLEKYDEMANMLCMVVKDHNGTYVKRKMLESQTALGLAESNIGSVSRIIMVAPSPELESIIRAAQLPINDAKICMDVYRI